MKIPLMIAASVPAVSLFAAFPDISGVTVEQTGGRVKVDYVLSAPAVVTVDFQTNNSAGAWVSIGAENFRELSGAVNCRVEAGSRSFVWKSRKEGASFKTESDAFRALLKVYAVSAPPEWMTLELASGNVRYYDDAAALPGGFSDDAYKTTHVLLKKIPAAGTGFFMGQAYGEMSGYAGSEIRHEVVFTNDFYLAVYETTKAQYNAVLPRDGYDALSAKLPMDSVSWNALRGDGMPADGHAFGEGSFFAVLNARSSCVFDLPTDAQWEFACRAGTSGSSYNGLGIDVADLDGISWNENNSDGVTHVVGGKEPSAFGLYDMLGNVLECCRDDYVESLGTERVVEPVVSGTGRDCVTRGGSFKYNAGNNVRAARRVSAPRAQALDVSGFRIWAEAVAR